MRMSRRQLPRVLIVADEYLGIQMMTDAVESCGYLVGGIARDVGSALEALACSAFDGVLLGIEPHETQCAELADRLKVRGIPFALVA